MKRTELGQLKEEVESLFHEDKDFILSGKSDQKGCRVAFVYLAFWEGYKVKDLSMYLGVSYGRVYEMKRTAESMMNSETYYLKVRELM